MGGRSADCRAHRASFSDHESASFVLVHNNLSVEWNETPSGSIYREFKAAHPFRSVA